jgi:hypothetical protein
MLQYIAVFLMRLSFKLFAISERRRRGGRRTVYIVGHAPVEPGVGGHQN